MALVNCPECNREISDSAKSCPHCGYKSKKHIHHKKKAWIILLIFLAIAIIGLIMFMLFKPCEHKWSEATCEEQKKCEICGEIDAEVVGHSWLEASCIVAKKCSVCNKTEGTTLAHTWIEATCIEPKKCAICNKIEGETLPHTWTEATCTEPKECTICNKTEGNAKGHVWKEATYINPKTCTICGVTEGNVIAKPELTVVGIYQMSYLDGLDTVSESLNFHSNGTVEHICNTNDENGYGEWSISGNTIDFTLFWDGSDHTLYEKATLVDGGIMWGSSYLRKIS